VTGLQRRTSYGSEEETQEGEKDGAEQVSFLEVETQQQRLGHAILFAIAKELPSSTGWLLPIPMSARNGKTTVNPAPD
jgi:hypothetical protein